MNAIYKLIDERRRMLGWSQEILASKSGVSISEIKRIEKGAAYREASVSTILDTIMGALNSRQLVDFGRDLDGLHEDVNKTGKIWSKIHSQCVRCGETVQPHIARGLCVRCYDKNIAAENTKHRVAKTYGESSNILTEIYLKEHYVNQQKSLNDIARECNCTRQYVHKKMKEFNIPLRDKSTSRILALDKDKISFNRTGEDGFLYKKILKHTRINVDFFSSWSDEMAYVLGVIYTDGNLQNRSHNPRTVKPYGRLKLAQKERELLDKILILMECDAQIYFSKRRQVGDIVAGEVYYFDIANQKIFSDLLNYGLSPQKSLVIGFPDVPKEYIRHFIRGCWDGDGSVYLDKRDNRIKASFVSGSLKFIEGLVKALKDEGIQETRINMREGKNPSYYIRYGTTQVPKLFRFLYHDVPESQYLKRKHDLFAMSEEINKRMPIK